MKETLAPPSRQDPLRSYAATDVGRVRPHNEDQFLVDKELSFFIVCDGMGGHAAGEVASAMAVATVHRELKASRLTLEAATGGEPGANTREVVALLERSVQCACSAIHAAAQSDPAKRGMGTTLSALLILGQQAFVVHVGDSRVYLLREGEVRQITEDHTVINELVKRGKLSRAQIDSVAQKNAITRAVGVYERVEVDTLVLDVLPGDTFLLSTDGLDAYVSGPNELRAPMMMDGHTCVRELIALANDRGGRDNITAVLVKVGDEGSRDEARAQRLRLKRDLLAGLPMFSRLSERELLRVKEVVESQHFDDGATILREGDPGDELFVVLSGHVRVTRGEATLSTLGRGQHFGEMSLIRTSPRSASVAAVGATELLALRRTDFFELLRKDHDIAVKILWEFLGSLADRLDRTSSDLRSARAELSGEAPAVELFPDEDDDEVAHAE